MTFSSLGLIAPILSAIERAGYLEPTPIQEQAVPPALAGRDILGCAQTGTGKTAAFAWPILQHLDRVAGDKPVLRALVLTPTRELAAQISENLSVYGRDLDLYHTVIFGGVNEKPQIRELREGVDILVATPGRLLDLLQRGFVSLARIEIFVLDEADRMLDMGFIHDVRRVIAALPKRRQTLLFSATIPDEIRQLSSQLLVDPVFVAVTPVSSTAERVEQSLYFTDKARKRDLLVHVLSDPRCTRSLVFCRTKHGADRVVKHLAASGIAASAIHGNKNQNARTRALAGFSCGKVPVLVATDIAARGIDVEGVSHVINYDLPNEPETYVHRIGRTARAGAAGVALSFCDHDERGYLDAIERLIGANIPRVEDHPFPPSEPPPSVREVQPGRGSQRRQSGPSRGARPAPGGAPRRGHQPRLGSGSGRSGGSHPGAPPGGSRAAQAHSGQAHQGAARSGQAHSGAAHSEQRAAGKSHAGQSRPRDDRPAQPSGRRPTGAPVRPAAPGKRRHGPPR